jgi:hypothetical protein
MSANIIAANWRDTGIAGGKVSEKAIKFFYLLFGNGSINFWFLKSSCRGNVIVKIMPAAAAGNSE